jgi:hypothetical protein
MSKKFLRTDSGFTKAFSQRLFSLRISNHRHMWTVAITCMNYCKNSYKKIPIRGVSVDPRFRLSTENTLST